MDYEWLEPKIRLIGPGFLGKLKCNCNAPKEVFCGSKEKIIGAANNSCNNNEKLKTGSLADGLEFPQLLFMIKLLGAFANRQDLKNLKQVSQLFYKLLNPIYLDFAQSVLSIGGRNGFRKSWELRQIWMSGTKRKQSFDCGIPPSTWNPELAYIFRKIIVPPYLSWLDYPELHYDGIHLKSLISQIRPYITILHMPIFILTLHPNCSEFINQFPKLEQVCIDFPDYSAIETELIDDSLTTLKIIIENLKKKSVKVKIKARSNYLPILEAFGNTSGTTVEIHIPRGLDYGPENVRIFTKLSDNSWKWRNIEFISLALNISEDPPSSELLSISSRYAKHEDQIQNCRICVFQFPPQHNLSEESTIQQCLSKFSPTLSRLYVWGANRWNVFGLSSGPIWPNLGYLQIHGLEIPLDFLKGTSTSSSFPALASLTMFSIDLDVCIFHDSQKPHKEALVTYFVNLPKLTFLHITRKDGTIDRLSPELVSSLTELIPNLKVRSSGLPELLNNKHSIHSY